MKLISHPRLIGSTHSWDHCVLSDLYPEFISKNKSACLEPNYQTLKSNINPSSNKSLQNTSSCSKWKRKSVDIFIQILLSLPNNIDVAVSRLFHYLRSFLYFFTTTLFTFFISSRSEKYRITHIRIKKYKLRLITAPCPLQPFSVTCPYLSDAC